MDKSTSSHGFSAIHIFLGHSKFGFAAVFECKKKLFSKNSSSASKECGDGNSKRYGQNHVWKIASYWCDDKEKWIAFKNRETELFQIVPLFGPIDFYPKLVYIENVLSAKC